MLRPSILFALVMLACAAASATDDPPPPEVNLAQELVFLGEHLRSTQAGQTLIYDFTNKTRGETHKNDEIRMTITDVVDDARRDLSFEFLTGEESLDFPPAKGYRGNPISVQFLERDIRNMARATETPIGYLRNRIRQAFVNPQISDVQALVGGNEVGATEIKVTPFVNDATLAESEGYAAKEYSFVYSDKVPGDLVSIRTRMLTTDGDLLVEESLQYARSVVEP